MTKEGQATRIFIQRLMNELNDNVVSNMLSSFGMQVDHSPMAISSGLFVYDWNILYLVNLHITFQTNQITYNYILDFHY